MGILIVAVIAVLALLGAPLFSITGSSALILFHKEGLGLENIAADVFGDKFARSPTLATIPLFTFTGYLLAESGTPKRLVEMSRALFGWVPGGLAVVCLLASAFFTTFSGASGVTIVAVGGVLLPALLADQYGEKFSLGLVTTGGSLGLLFPPSLPILLYGIVARDADGHPLAMNKLFLAGIVPGIVSVLALSAYGVGRGWKLPRTPFDAKNAGRALWVAKWEVLLPFLLIGGLYFGRIHEAAAFTALYALVIEFFVYRDLSIKKDLTRVVRDSMVLVGAIMMVLAAAFVLTNYLVREQIADALFEKIRATVHSRVMFLIALNVFLLVVGMLMEGFSAIVVVAPLIAGLAARYEINPYHLAIIFLFNLEIAYLTPPIGLNLFISSFRFRRPVVQLYRSVGPFILILVGALLLVTYWEGLSLWLTRFASP